MVGSFPYTTFPFAIYETFKNSSGQVKESRIIDMLRYSYLLWEYVKNSCVIIFKQEFFKGQFEDPIARRYTAPLDQVHLLRAPNH